MSVVYWLKRHPFPVRAYFRHSLVLTYALPVEVLQPLLPPRLTVDAHNDLGFVAIAMVQTRKLRPGFMPQFLGRNFFLSGYRIFSRFTTADGRKLRGLRILRSDTDSRIMAASGNLLTNYNYQKADVRMLEQDGRLELVIKTKAAVADLHVVADIANRPGPLPPSSPFSNLSEARYFAGPLPWTFSYEKETHSLVLVKGVRENWDPQPVSVDVKHVAFFGSDPFRGVQPALANAFYVHDIPYRWERGVQERLPQGSLQAP